MHLDLDVLFGRFGAGYQAQVLGSPAGDGQSVMFELPFTDLELENFLLKMHRFRSRARHLEIAPVVAAKEFGGRLFDAVFTGAVGECLRRSVDRAQDEHATLRIRLRFSGCAELAELPWELLYDRSDDWFLALSDRTAVVRYVPLPVQPRGVPIALPLRILVIRSEPLDCPALDLQAEWAQVQAALRDLIDAGAVVFNELAVPTLTELRRALLRDTFHVLHYMGHGAFDTEHGGVLLFTDRAGRSQPVTAADLGVLLHDHISMTLAVLNACEAGRTNPDDPFAGVAETLVRRGIPAVIAMQFEVSDTAAIEFAPALYGALAAGRPVDAAVAEARKAIYTVSPLEWATPVLYLRAEDAQLFDITQQAAPCPEEHQTAARADARYRDNLYSDQASPLAGIADQLALAVGSQWQTEAATRRLNDPYPLPVSWLPAEVSLCDSWDVLVRLADSGAGWSTRSLPVAWAASRADLAGGGSDLVGVLARVPTGRLVVLGEPGAGKTMLMVRLVLDLLACRSSGGPVPVLVSLASWNPGGQDLRGWLAGELMINHPALAAAAPSGAAEGTRIEALLAAGLILPILDGLDEIPEAARGPAITLINDALRPGEQVVLTCRTDPYRAAIRPPGGPEVTVRAAAAVELAPLDPAAVCEYLRDDAGGPAAAARWNPVIAALGASGPLTQVLCSPLMVGLARVIYNPRPGEHTGTLPNPATLCALADPAAIGQHLFDAFIPAAYRGPPRRPAGSHRWTAASAEKWLTFIARHLEGTIRSPDLAWWRLQQAVPPVVSGLGAGAAVGLAIGIASGVGAGAEVGVAVGLAGCLAGGLAIGLAAARWRKPEPSRGLRWRAGVVASGLAVGAASGLAAGLAFGLRSVLSSGLGAGLRAGLPAGLSVGLSSGLAIGLTSAKWRLPEPSRGLRWQARFSSLAAGLAAGIAAGLAVGLPYGLAFGLASGLAVGLAAVLTVGLEGVPRDLTAAATPRAVLRRDRAAALAVGAAVGIGVGVVFGLGFNLSYGLISGSASGLGVGLMVSMLKTASPAYGLARGWLALRRRLPWSLMSFLDDAHQRGVLRQVGAIYQFRHIELQHRLATRPPPLGDTVTEPPAHPSLYRGHALNGATRDARYTGEVPCPRGSMRLW